MNNTAIIIPSLEPGQILVELVNDIRRKISKTSHIIVVNDGSEVRFNRVFDEIRTYAKVTVLHHSKNHGKGRALKTAFSYVLEKLPDIEAVVTIDSDGQHTFNDMKKCLKAYSENQDAIIFGSRSFKNNKAVPFKSRFGNILTSYILELTTGLSLEDTQTGLRVIGRKYLEALLDVEGERFEYEMNMILFAKEEGIKLIEVPIETIYHNDNKGSHFNPLLDSIRIYMPFIKYGMTYILSYILRWALFIVVIASFSKVNFLYILIANVLVDFVGSFALKFMHSNLLKDRTDIDIKKGLPEVIIKSVISSVFIYLLFSRYNFSLTWVKLVCDLVIYVVFRIIKNLGKKNA